MNNQVNMITLVGEPILDSRSKIGFSWNVVLGKSSLVRRLIMSQIRSNYMYLNPNPVEDGVIHAYKDSVSLKDIEVGYIEHFDYEELDALGITEFAVFVRQIADHFGYGFSVFMDAADWGPLIEPFKYYNIEAKRFKLIYSW